ncbi:hypothetical protein ANCCAN_21194 [Ancylostoma caninum]|uniref:Uncharacterized protein n=1 Tax=Ancylostoma caninum TaxID=29170 RepID=A0A368FQA3_ANCCA|nr:hypothetical protein ANCCAN_21194 [Ancylostoma caninum]
MLEYVRDIRKTLASQWSPDFNLLHVLMELPMKVWSNAGFWRGQSAPAQQLYDVSPIINDILLVRFFISMLYSIPTACLLGRGYTFSHGFR